MHTRPAVKRTIAIIGAGYSGTLTAVNILRSNPSDNVRVVLVEQDSTPGRGLAYRFGDDNHVLNVPAGNMSALADEPDHFVVYCRDIDPALTAKSFVSRRIYGDYLQWTLAESETSHPGTLEKIKGEAIAIVPDASNEKFRIELAGGRSFGATQVVLAVGHFSPRAPHSVPASLQSHLVNPWDFSALNGLDETRPVAILGTGHTAVDVLFGLTSRNRTRKVYLVSRRGLLPHGHRSSPTAPIRSVYPAYLAGLQPTVLGYSRALREEVARREACGDDWRDVLNELRPHLPLLWQALPHSERARARAVLPYWDIHRHRLAPAAARRLANLLVSGQVERFAGRITGFDGDGSNFSVQITGRGDGRITHLDVGAVVNCTGPGYDLYNISSPLITNLMSKGLIMQDSLKLGLLVDDHYRIIDLHNQPNADFFYVGPMLKAKYWEAVAVPELRNHARKLAKNLTSPENMKNFN